MFLSAQHFRHERDVAAELRLCDKAQTFIAEIIHIAGYVEKALMIRNDDKLRRKFAETPLVADKTEMFIAR